MENDKEVIRPVKAWAHGGYYVMVPSTMKGKQVKIVPIKEAEA